MRVYNWHHAFMFHLSPLFMKLILLVFFKYVKGVLIIGDCFVRPMCKHFNAFRIQRIKLPTARAIWVLP